ncbi:hypothetical protein MCOR27_007383 [Pyricularia oryzae]|uniref:Very-long-chain (3R)-3-hydroxyacyl-CoA dehydratase n=5 Tax=Pyricularia TaxID=48558 RepID=A0ABQ8NQV0_PYRGI|nr:uncharacterized protein MGG_04972 [Pyricularia oryzae 70-15]ELQ44613.1 hypothetical protein OOU_Y34scaffold00071g29 [Pyricularia oryzae Y34]KAH8847859.1 hypothetical protein MCOR01_001254 [Pyricularia oryzae]KAI6299469.1 hypothetical protein MCOR33_004602 [Pyricularia grisea]EHA52664.1 hypothetical protein MGG_04972 [Pyricularia oryzae 70-15]KAH9430206.1 hypothetical protein MCOR02_009926 [Pyricularia oryzae]
MATKKQSPAAVSAAPKSAKKTSSPIADGYLFFYNAASAILWAAVLGRVLLTNYLQGPEFVPLVVMDFARWTQTLAGLEILHVAIGLVRTSLITTAMQVGSRYLLVWGVVWLFPSVATSPGYSSMLSAWATTEVIRYTYFALLLAGVDAPGLAWLRYSTFIVLYPVGILSECWMMWLAATSRAEVTHPLLPTVYYIILFVVYPPGSVHMYSHMWKQRSKVLSKAKNHEKAN